MSIRYKISRVLRWARVVGICEALRFEVVWSSRPQQVKIRVPTYPQHFLLRRAMTDVSVFESVFIERELAGYRPVAPRLIIDGGANTGLSTAFYAHSYPDARVIAVEPEGENVAMLRTNTHSFENVTVVPGGLWSDPGFLQISNPHDAAWAFRCEPAAESPVAIRALTVADIIRLSGVDRCDLLKLDIEGAEEQLFKSSHDWLAAVQAILVEVHGDGALAAMRAACPPETWQYRRCGEKTLLTRRD